MFTYNYMSIFICLYVHLYEYLGMIYTSDNKSVYIQIYEIFLQDSNCTSIKIFIFEYV